MRRRVELLSEAVFETDEKNRVVIVNAAWQSTLGFDRTDCLGHPLLEFAYPEDRPTFADLISHTSATRTNARTELRALRSDGTIAWINISLAALPTGGVVGAFHDITERKIAQDEIRKLSVVASSTDNLVIITGPDRRIEWVNQAFSNLTGYAHDEVIGKNPGHFLQGPDTDLATVSRMRQALRAGLSIREEILNYSKSGRSYWTSINITPIARSDGQVDRFISVQSDITQKKHYEQQILETKSALEERARELALSRDRAEQATRAKSSFVANMSHEIRTPLNGVLAMADLLLTTELDDQQRQYAQSAQRAGQHLLHIINDVLDLSRIESGKLELQLEAASLTELMQESATLFADLAQQKGLELLVDLPPRRKLNVLIDATRFLQVVGNLLANAIKFTDRGQIVLSLSVETETADSVELSIRIEDTGIGIPADAIGSIFAQFSQADTSASRQYGGSGLGLTICRQLVALMGGTVDVSSAVGSGSTFKVGLGLEKVLEGDTPEEEDLVLSGQSILVVASNRALRTITSKMVLGLGGVPVEADSAKAAMSILERSVAMGQYISCALVADKVMNFTGAEVSDALAQMNVAPIHIGLLSAFGTKATNAGENRQGLVRRLQMPLLAGELRKFLSAALGSQAPSSEKQLEGDSFTQKFSPIHARVLLVEDNEINQIAALSMLRLLGTETMLATGGEEALELVSSSKFDVILMDCNMPGMDGFATTAQIRSRAPLDAKRVPIIAVTANVLAGQREYCIAHGMDDYLGKPYDLLKLRSVLSRWCVN